MDAVETMQNSFYYCYERVKEINRENIAGLNFVIDQLNSLNYQTLNLCEKEVEDLLMMIVKLLPEDNNHMLSKFCFIVITYVNKLKITLNDECLHLIVKYLVVASLKSAVWVLPDVLSALSAILYKNVSRIKKFHCELIGQHGILQRALSTCDPHVIHAAFKMLQSLTIRKSNDDYLSDDDIHAVFVICVSGMKSYIIDIDSVMSCKIIISSLKCSQHVMCSKNMPVQNLGEMLGLLKVLQFCGFPGQPTLAPVYLYPTLMALPGPQQQQVQENSATGTRYKSHKNRTRRQNAGKKTMKSDSINITDFSKNCLNSLSLDTKDVFSTSSFSDSSESTDVQQTSSSESEFSDSEENRILKLKSLHALIRQHAYITFHSVVKGTEKKLMWGYWSSFLPDSPATTGFNNLNIFTTILKDPSSEVRFSAINVLTDMMRGSKQFLSLVDGRSSSRSSFITASSSLTTMIYEVHRCLLLALISESSSSVLTQILKCYATLVENVPYSRLDSDILFKLWKHLKPLLYHKDLQVQVACLTVFGSMLNSDHIPEKITEQILSSADVSSSNDINNSMKSMTIQSEHIVSTKDVATVDLPWIVHICKNNVNTKHPLPLPVRIESLQVLTVLSSKYFSTVRPFINTMKEIILVSLQDEHSSLQLHGAKLLESIGRGLLNNLNSEESKETEGYVGIQSDMVLELWNEILCGPFRSCLSNIEQNTLRSVCCDCLSTIPPNIFEKLHQKIQVYCITMLFGLSSDNDNNVRGASVRCLSIFSLFPSLREDMSFLGDVARTLNETIDDSNVIVRAKASWALGNLSDAIFLSRDEYPDFTREISPAFIYSVGMSTIKASEDCDRVKANAVRALGNFASFLPPHFMTDSKIKEFVEKGQSSLLLALESKMMKVCWNACYAFRNMLSNKAVITSNVLNLNVILEKLLNILSSSNFKVRINAVLALSALPERCYYSNCFVAICDKFLRILTTAQDDIDFKELQHYECLCATICFALCQLMCLVELSDLVSLSNVTQEAGELLLTSLWKFGQIATEDKITFVFNASDHISTLCSMQNQHVKKTIDLWQDLLDQVKSAYAQR